MTENELSKIVFNLGLKVHKELGPGLLESAYEECLFYEINKYGLFVQKQKTLPLIYEDVKLDIGYRIDLLIENKLIIEIKSVEALNDLHLAQLLTYLKLSNCKLGLLINSNTIEKGIYDLQEGDVLFVRSSVKPSGVGLTTVINDNLTDVVYSGFLIRFRNKSIKKEFKRYCFDSKYFRDNLISNSTVSANTNINQNALSELLLLYPKSLPEQTTIATVLSDIDEYILSLERLIAKKQAIKQGAMQQLFSGKWLTVSGQWLVQNDNIIRYNDEKVFEIYGKNYKFAKNFMWQKNH